MEHIVLKLMIQDPFFPSSFLWMEHIVSKLVIWEEILDQFYSHSYFIPKSRSLSWILHNSNEGGHSAWAREHTAYRRGWLQNG